VRIAVYLFKAHFTRAHPPYPSSAANICTRPAARVSRIESVALRLRLHRLAFPHLCLIV